MSDAVRILHVDGDRAFAKTAADALERERDDFEVTTATSLEAARERLGDGPVDCVVSEYRLPDGDGIQLLEAVRERDPERPFVLLTGHGSEEVAAAALDLDASAYRRKEPDGTVQYAELADRIATHVDRYRTGGRSGEPNGEYALVAETATDLFWTLDTREDRLTVRAGLDSFGYETGLDGTHDSAWFFERVHPDDRDRVRGHYRSLLSRAPEAFDELHGDRGTFSTALRFRRADGTYVPCAWRGVVQYADGDPTTVVGTLTRRSGGPPEETRDTELEALVRASPDPIVFITEDGTLQRWNPAAADLFGWSASEASADPSLPIPEDRGEEFTEVRDHLLGADGSSVTGFETQRRRKDGTLVDVYVSTAPVRDESGELLGTMAVLKDITDRKAIERTVQRERDRRAALFENSPDPIMDVRFEDGTALVRDVNGAFESVFGVDAAEATDRTVADVVVPETERDEHDRLRERVFEGDPVETEVRRETAEGVREFSLRIIPIHDAEEDSAGAYAWYTDVTERKRRERILEAAQRRFEAVFNNPIAFMAILDPDGTVTEINETALEFVDVPAETVEGEPFPETPFWTHDDALQADLRSWIERAAAGDLVRFEADHYGADGQQVTIDGVLHPIRDDGGTVVSILAAGRDISDRKDHERALERQNERLDEFVSIVSHDLRNPLNVASGRIELAREECDSDHLPAVQGAIERMRAMVDDLLTLAREGATPAEVEPVAVAAVAERAWETVATGGATLGTPTDRVVLADDGRLRQLFENLFRNAIEHGGGDVTVTVEDLPGGFAVTDDGPGVDPDARDRVFESGFSTSEGGTGLGLSIVSEIAQAHGWSVSVEKGPEGGARFALRGVELPDEG